MLKEAQRQRARDDVQAGATRATATANQNNQKVYLDDDLTITLKDIVQALINYHTNDNRFTIERFKSFKLRKNE